MEKYNKIVGNYGEELATNFLEKNKYKIIEKNYSCKLGELDIIAKDKDILVFIEVKSRTNKSYGEPGEAITYYKKKNIIKTAQYYIMKNKLQNEFCRFDVVEILLSDDDNNIRLIKNAFMME